MLSPPAGSDGVSGRVLAENGEGVHGVVVTNGRRFTRTDSGGEFQLPPCDDERFVSVTVPSGYRSLGPWYAEATAGHCEFVLVAEPRRAADVFRFVQITDIHLSTEQRCLPEDLAEDLQRIADAEPDLDFLIASGDLTAGGKAEEFAAYREAMAATGLPCYHAAGNHDDDAEVAGDHFQDALGPLHYSFDWGPVHFVVYDGEACWRQGATVDETVEAFPYRPSRQDEWLRADLAAHAGHPIVVVNHFPWGRPFYGQWQGCGLVATLSGHWHASRRIVDDGTVHYNTPSLCFGGIDQTQRGYRSFTWEDRQLRSCSRVLDPKPLWPGVDGWEPPAAPASRSPRRLWTTAAGGGIHTASCVVGEGLVVQTLCDPDGADGCGVVAVDALNGKPSWRHRTTASIRHAAALTDGRVYTVTMTGQVLALSAVSGETSWSYQLGEATQRWVYSAPLAAHGRIYAGVSSHLVALDAATGAVIWKRDDFGVDDWICSYASPAAAESHLVVAFYTQPVTLAVLDPVTGATRWTVPGDKAHYMYSTPVIDGERVITVSGSAVRAYGLASGSLIWEQGVSLGRVQTTPAVAAGRLFVATGTGLVQALDTGNGDPLWSWQVPTAEPRFTPYVRRGPTTLTSPAVSADRVWVGGADGALYGLHPREGSLQAWADLGAPIAAAPIVSGQRMWVGTTDGAVHGLTFD